MTAAVGETVELSLDAFLNNNLQSAEMVEPLDKVIDGLKEENRKSVKKAMAEANELYSKYKDKRDYEVVQGGLWLYL